MDDIIEKLKHRFATKIFDPSFHITEDLEDKIEDILNLAPTSFGLQPFKLIKISAKKDREAIKKISWEQGQITDCSLLYILAVETDVNVVLARYEKLQTNMRNVDDKKAKEYSKFIRNFLDQKSSDSSFYETWATRQLYLAMGFFLSVATFLGVDTAPMEGFDEDKLNKLFNLDKYNLSSKVLLCIGRRAASDGYPKLAKIRKSKSDLVINI